MCPGLSVENVRRLNTGLADSPRISIELDPSFVPLYLEIPAWSPVPGLFCSALSIARRLTRNRASPRRVHNRIAAGLAATVKLALCGFCTTDTNNILAENRWSLANRVCLHESVFIREIPGKLRWRTFPNLKGAVPCWRFCAQRIGLYRPKLFCPTSATGYYSGDGDSRISFRFGDLVSFNCTDGLTASLTALP